MTIASTEEEVIVPEIVRSSDEWAEIIKGDLGRAVEGIVSAGRNLIAAKADVQHGEWLPMLAEIGIGEDMAGRLMRIGRNDALSNSASLRNLPTAVMALYELSRMGPDDIEDGIQHGRITPDMTIKDAKQYATGDARPAPREKTAEEKQAATLSLINDLRGPWRKGITHAAKSMNNSSRAYLIEALEEALNDIREIQE